MVLNSKTTALPARVVATHRARAPASSNRARVSSRVHPRSAPRVGTAGPALFRASARHDHRSIARRAHARVRAHRARAPASACARHAVVARATPRARAFAAGAPWANIDVSALKDMLDSASDDDTMFVDVRERDEWDAARLPRFELKPLSAAGEWLETLPRDKKLVVVCKAGVRSEKACAALAQCGYDDLVNVEGGIMTYAQAYGLPAP